MMTGIPAAPPKSRYDLFTAATPSLTFPQVEEALRRILMLKRALVVLSVAVVVNLAAGDPLQLHRIDISGIWQQVRNVAEHLSRGEFQELVSNSMRSVPRKH
jgi:hypothetical protein